MNFSVSDMMYYNEHMEMYEAQTLVEKIYKYGVAISDPETLEADDE